MVHVFNSIILFNTRHHMNTRLRIKIQIHDDFSQEFNNHPSPNPHTQTKPQHQILI